VYQEGEDLEEEEDYDSDDIVTCRKKQLKTSLLTTKLSDSDSDLNFTVTQDALTSSSDSAGEKLVHAFVIECTVSLIAGS